jgi:hypothetical protein
MIHFAWDPGTIGAFAKLSELQQANRRMLQDLADDGNSAVIGRAVAAGVLRLRDLTAGAAPVDTGTLRSAHRGEVKRQGSAGAVGVVYIDPYARNPVNRAAPAYYGEIWASRNVNWFERIESAYGDSVMEQIEQTIIDRIEDLWR